jgi:hypothetical protein
MQGEKGRHRVLQIYHDGIYDTWARCMGRVQAVSRSNHWKAG